MQRDKQYIMIYRTAEYVVIGCITPCECIIIRKLKQPIKGKDIVKEQLTKQGIHLIDQ
jgi:hypothetical protein